MATVTTYKYSVRDRSGKLVNGKLDAETESAVVQRLKSMGYAPVSISEANTGMNKELKIPGFGGKVKLKDLAIFARQFATMINSGLSLMRALSILAEQTENKEPRRRHRRGPQRRRGRRGAVGRRWPSTRRSSRR